MRADPASGLEKHRFLNIARQLGTKITWLRSIKQTFFLIFIGFRLLTQEEVWEKENAVETLAEKVFSSTASLQFYFGRTSAEYSFGLYQYVR